MRGHISKTLSLSLVAGLALCVGAAQGQVWLKSSPDQLTTIGDANQAVGAQLAGLRSEFDRRIAVQLDVRADAATRELMAADGLELLSPIGNDAFFARLAANANVQTLAESKMIRGASAIDPSWKIDRKLLGNIYQLYNVSDPAVTRDADPVVPVLVMLHADVRADAMSVPKLLPHAERVRGALETIPVFVAEVRQSKIAALAREDVVQWIAPALPELGELNSENRTLTQAAQLQAAPYNLTGAGVAVLVYDSGWVQTTHVDFQGRASVIDPDTDTNSGHSTHCAGTVGGGGVANPTHRGMAPGVQILSAGTGSLASGWLYSNPLDIETNYTAGVNAGADLATNSIGTNVASNGFDCAWHGDYNVTDVLIDNIVRGALPATQQRPFRVTWAAGNERGNGRCGTTYATTAPPSNNKNAMVIGAIDSVTQAMTAFSSWGPTQDGRMRPDFSTGGCQSGGDVGVTSTTTSTQNNTSYASLCGTSMATPTVAGVSALILQDFRVQYPEVTSDPRNSFLKALLAHTAVDLGIPGPDYQFGYGSIRAQAAIDLMRTGQFLEASLVQGETQTRVITVPPGATELEVTIAWDDVPGTPNVVPSLVNDVDMTLTGPAGPVNFPWSLNPASPADGATTTGANRRDNIEQIRIANPPAGAYELDLIGFNIPVGSQPVSVVSSHPITGASGTPRLVLTAQTLTESVVTPSTPQTVSVTITARADTVVSNSAVLKYAERPGMPWQAVAMTQNGNVWSAQLPGFVCGAEPVYYFEATGEVSGLFTLPANIENPYTFGIGSRVNRVLDTMQVNQGFTVTNTPINATLAVSGAWELADPELTQAVVNQANLIIQPGDDRTPGAGTLCWVTGAAAGATAGATDIDNLTTTLTSPAYDAASYVDPMLSFWRWFNNNGNTTRDDVMIIQLSNDNGASWQTVETIAVGSPESRGGWFQSNLRLTDYFATPSANVRFRVTVADAGGASIVEALIDDVTLSEPACVRPPACDDIDFNNNGVFPEDQDVVDFFNVLAGASCAACNDLDFNNNGAFPEDQDVVDFLHVLGGGECP
jgi:hypothetical protein